MRATETDEVVDAIVNEEEDFDELDADKITDEQYLFGFTNDEIDSLFDEAKQEGIDEVINEDLVARDGVTDWWNEAIRQELKKEEDELQHRRDAGFVVDFADKPPVDPVLEFLHGVRTPENRLNLSDFKGSTGFGLEELKFYESQMQNGRLFGVQPAGEGDTVPADTSLYVLDDVLGTLNKTNASALFGGKPWAVFGMEGAFMPMDTFDHLPAIEEWADYMRKCGINIAIVSTNDPHTLKAWSLYSGYYGKFHFVSDVDGELAASLGLLKETEYGMRNERYSMLIANNTILKLNWEVTDDLAETLPGPLIQSYKRRIADLQNTTAGLLQEYVKLNTLMESQENIRWYVERFKNRRKDRFKNLKDREDKMKGPGNMKLQTVEEELEEWDEPTDYTSNSAPPSIDTKYRRPRQALSNYLSVLPYYYNDDNKDDLN